MAVSKTLAAITTRAKKIRGKNKNIAWIAAVKTASKQLRSEGKIGKAKPTKKAPVKKLHQTGTSDKSRDEQRTAQTPGKHIVKHGRKKTTKYYEYRKNRSDMPGKLTGTNNKSIVVAQLNELVKGNENIDRQIAILKQYIREKKDKAMIPAYKKQLQYLSKLKATNRKNISNLKRLI